MINLKSHLVKGYPEKVLQKALYEVKVEDWKLALQQKHREEKPILHFVT